MPEKTSKKPKIVAIFIAITAVLAVLIFLALSSSKPITSLSELKTDLESVTLDITFGNYCSVNKTYEIDFKKHDSLVTQEDASESTYFSKLYFLGSKENAVYQKYLSNSWQKIETNEGFTLPDAIVKQILESLKDSESEKTNGEGGSLIFDVKEVKDAETVYASVNGLVGFGNNWGAKNFKSITAKAYLKSSGNIEKIVFYPVGIVEKTEWDAFDAISECEEVIFTFSNINRTKVEYQEVLSL